MTPRWMRVPIFSSKAKSYYVIQRLVGASYAMRSTLPIEFSDVPLVPPSDGTRRRNEDLSHLILNSHDWRGCSWREDMALLAPISLLTTKSSALTLHSNACFGSSSLE